MLGLDAIGLMQLPNAVLFQAGGLLPCAMHHAAWVMHHAPCTMHHAPCTMHHASCAMHHAPCMHEAQCKANTQQLGLG